MPRAVVYPPLTRALVSFPEEESAGLRAFIKSLTSGASCVPTAVVEAAWTSTVKGQLLDQLSRLLVRHVPPPACPSGTGLLELYCFFATLNPHAAGTLAVA